MEPVPKVYSQCLVRTAVTTNIPQYMETIHSTKAVHFQEFPKCTNFAGLAHNLKTPGNSGKPFGNEI